MLYLLAGGPYKMPDPMGQLGSLSTWQNQVGRLVLQWAATSNVDVGQMRSIVGPLMPKFKTKVLSEVQNFQTSHQQSCFVILRSLFLTY